MEESKSFAVGHFAVGYLVSKISGKILNVDLNIPLLLTLSILPDIDIAVKEFFPEFMHRGPTHSVIVALIVFAPLFAVYRKRAAPYLLALVQHSLISDYVGGGGVQLFWPLTLQDYGIKLDIRSTTNMAIETGAFILAAIVMFGSRDIFKLFRKESSNLVLIIPTATVLLPTFLKFPMDVPLWLLGPHVFYLVVFLVAITIMARKALSGYRE